jgi:hypothetical protein
MLHIKQNQRFFSWWTALQICLGPNSIPCIFDADKLQQIFKTTSTSMDGTLWLITMLETDFVNSQPAYNGMVLLYCVISGFFLL